MRLRPGRDADAPMSTKPRRTAWVSPVVVALLLTAAVAASGRWLDLRRLSGEVKGDKASYIAMAFSVAFDHDLRYTPADFARYWQLYGTGPEGIYLKRIYRTDWHLRAGWPPVAASKVAVPTDQALAFGKPFIYSVAAAPF